MHVRGRGRRRHLLCVALVAVSWSVPCIAAPDKPRDERPSDEACQGPAQRYRGAEEILRKAKEQGAPVKTIERRTRDLERVRRDYCECLTRPAGADKPPPDDLEAICGTRFPLPVPTPDMSAGIPSATPTPAPPAGAACAEDAATYEQAWMRYSENTKNKALHRQVQSAKNKLCGCLARNHGYEGVLPQRLRAFCEDREILTPPYFPSRGETPQTAAP